MCIRDRVFTVAREGKSKCYARSVCREMGDGNLKHTTNHCGSEPARDGDVTVNDDVECYGLIASRLAPTGFDA